MFQLIKLFYPIKNESANDIYSQGKFEDDFRKNSMSNLSKLISFFLESF